MPSFLSLALKALPTPQMIETGLSPRKSMASSSPMMEKPRGLLRSEATFARNLLKLRPTETVIPISSSMRFTRRSMVRAGGAWCRRSVPLKSMKASSMESGSTNGVSSRIRARTSPPAFAYFSMFGFTTTASGQALSALNMGMAEPTPRIRAI